MTTALRAPRRRSPLVVVIGLSLVSLLAELGYQTTIVAAMPYFLRSQLGLAMRWIGLINMAFLVAETAGKIPFGILGDRYGRRLFILLGPLLSAMAALAIAHVPPPWMIALLRAWDGLGAAMLWPAVFAAIADAVEERRRATAMSLFNVMYVAGLVLGPTFYSRLFAHTHSYVAIFYYLAVFFLLCVVVGALAAPPRLARAQGSVVDEESAFARRSAWSVIRGSSVLMAMLVVALVQFSGLHMLNGVITIYLKEQVGVSEVMFGHLFLCVGIVVGALALPMGWLADRMSHSAAVRLGLGLCAVGMWLLAWAESIPLLVMVAGLFGVGFLLAAPSWMALMTQLAGEECRGGVVSIINTAQGVGASLGVAAGSGLYDLIGPRAPFVASALLFTISAWVVFRYVR